MSSTIYAKKLCDTCNRELPKDTSYCKYCGTYNLSPVLAGGVNNQHAEDDEVVRLSDATVSIVERIPTLHPAMDLFFGGGLARTSTNLIGGEPGAGKTTIMLQLAELLIKQFDKDVLYIANEQAPKEIRDTGVRLGLKRMHEICVVKAMGGLRSNLFDLVYRYKPCMIIVDSLPKLVGHDLEMAVRVADDLKAVTVEMNAPSMIVNQVTKGLDHAGLQKLQHAVDMTGLIYSEGGTRYWTSDKNRFGPAPLAIKMEMRQNGLSIIGMVEDDEKEESEEGDEGDE